jgi:hypothetical protein
MMRLSENLRTVTNADGGVVLDLRKGKIFRLNAVGATIFELLVRGSEEEQIVADISSRCGIAPALASRDLQEFLAVLAANNLLCRRDPE